MRLILLALTLMSASGCGIFTPEKTRMEEMTEARVDVCSLFHPIYFSREDTVDTQDQVIDYLITLHSLCGDDAGDL